MSVSLRRVFFGAIAAAAIAACFVDLDPPLDATVPAEAGSPPDQLAPIVDARVDAPATTECVTIGDCNPGDAPGTGCLSSTCVAGKCQYTVCGGTGASCSLTTCNKATNTCNPTPTALNFGAGAFSFDLDSPLDAPPVLKCSNTASSPNKCFAAVYPFIFVAEASRNATANAYAYDVSDPTNPNPVGVPIQGVDFLAQSVVASGRRVYFVDQATTNPRIAWLDVPTNPFAKTLTASSVAVAYPTVAPLFPTTAFPAPNGGLYLYAANAVDRFDPVVSTGNPFVFQPFQPVSGGTGTPVATDSTHLYYASNSANQRLAVGAAVNIETKQSALPTGLVDSGIGPLTAQVYYAAGPDSLLVSTAVSRDAGLEAGPRLDEVAVQRFDASTLTDSYSIETYANAANTVKASGPLVSVDGGAVTLAQHDTVFNTYAKRITFDSADPSGSLDLDASTFTEITVLSSNGYVYVVHWRSKEAKVFVDVLAADCPSN